MRVRAIAAFLIVAVLMVMTVGEIASVGGAAFTTFNPAVDGEGKDICKNSEINCNIYGDKEYVWLNGGPGANHLKPDGDYFFAVLVPGGQPDPNDGGAKNLSDDYDTYEDRTFTTENGEVSIYTGPHDLDSGTGKVCHNPHGCAPDGEPPLIRLYPYADTWNPGGVYILAICSLADGYPVEPRDCKYDAFKVKEGRLTYEFMLGGAKFHDRNADGVWDPAVDYGLPGWQITINGTGFANEPIAVTLMTDGDGYWSYGQSYTFGKRDPVYTAHLTVCEVLQEDWYPSYPIGDPVADPDGNNCYELDIEPAAMAYVGGLDFGNYQKVNVEVCKLRDLDSSDNTTDDRVPLAGWPVALTEEGEIVEWQETGEDGCFVWSDLMPGPAYDAHEEVTPGWLALSPTDCYFEPSLSGDGTFYCTFINAPVQGCTPGFWQGGPDKPDAKAGGALLWDGLDVPPGTGDGTPPPYVDPQWTASGGAGGNPYIHTTIFNDFFGGDVSGDLTMFELVDTGGGSENWRKAARSLTAAYLNASWGMAYAYTVDELVEMWNAAVSDPVDPDAALLALHTELDLANNYYYNPYGGCPISASGW